MDKKISELIVSDTINDFDVFAKATVSGESFISNKVPWRIMCDTVVAAAVAAALSATQALINAYLDR